MHKFLLSLPLLAFLGYASAQTPAGEAPVAPEPEAAAPTIVVPQQVTPKNTSLMKVNVTFQAWNPRIPWQKNAPAGRRGLGVLISGNRILVTGQLVADATYIELELADTGQKIPAKAKAVDYEANLALLEVAGDAKTFFSGLTPASIETGAGIGDQLQTWQLGRVGDLIVTPLQINKVVTAPYALQGSFFLVYETIGIIRSEANSFTLPVMKDGKLAGMLLRYDSTNQTSTVLPGPIIEHFLKDLEDGTYEGFPGLGVEFQQTLDEQFREYLGIKGNPHGVYISETVKGSSAEAIGIKEGDILLELNGFPVDARGDYQDPKFGTLNMSHIVRGASYVGDDIKVKILREGKEQELHGKLVRKNAKDYTVTPYFFDRGANYLVQGGLIFQELNLPYLQSFGDEWDTAGPLRLVFVASHTEEYEKAGKRKIVFLVGALPTISTQGYEGLRNLIVTKANDKVINDLADLENAFKEPADGRHTVEFEEVPKKIYLDTFATESDNIRILNGYRLNSLKRIE